MIPLPIDRYLPQITAALADAPALVLVAEPGAGKTTRVPPAMLRAGLLDRPGRARHLIMLQPRRVAARAAAARIAEENAWTLGHEVGYHVRFEKRLTAATRLRVLTEGILTRQLLDDPFLEDVGCVILDEFHERSLHTDLALALLREVQQTVRPDLLLVVMSATLAAEPVAAFLGQPNHPCPIIQAEGRTFPIDISFFPPPETQGLQRHALLDHTARTILKALASDPWPLTPGPSSILVFLPGADEIRRVQERLSPAAPDLIVHPLHGSLPWEEQLRALQPAPNGQWKMVNGKSPPPRVILATNIAETSLTLPDVRTVIDTGLARIAGFDADRGLDRLDLVRISRASSAQRAGRAGRTAPGRCIRLWSQREDRLRADFELPEIQRVDLAATVLALHAWGHADPREFPWFEAPPEATLATAEDLLEMLGAITPETPRRITDVGRRLLTLPVHPRLGRLLLAAAETGLLEPAATLAALLEEKDLLVSTPRDSGPRTLGPSDLLLRLEAYDHARRDRFAPHLRDQNIDPNAARQVDRTRQDLLTLAQRLTPTAHEPRPEGRGLTPPPTEEFLLRMILHAYPDRVVKRRANNPAAGVMVGGGGVRLANESIVWQSPFYVAVEARHDRRAKAGEALVRIASHIDESWLEELFPHEIRTERSVAFDESRARVIALARIYYRDLLLREDRQGTPDPHQAAAVLAAALRPRAAEIFQADEPAAAFLARVAFLRRALPELPWPPFDLAQLAGLLADACPGHRGLDDLRAGGLIHLLRAALPYDLARRLDTDAPETLTVPSGSRIKIQYPLPDENNMARPSTSSTEPSEFSLQNSAGTPILAVRLQELFGLTDTPRLAAGRVPVLLHLLGPNFRPVQITADLRSFWQTAYFEVRKDLRIRYPKHAWPEDPLTAKPQAKGRL